MADLEVKVGSVVFSLKGRDKGRYSIVTSIINHEYVYVVDGEIRLLTNPKKKNLKHIKVTHDCFENISTKLVAGQKVFDKEISSALRIFNKKD